MRKAWNALRLGVLVGAAVFASGTACVITIDPNDGGGSPRQRVRVVVVNNTNVTLDPEIFVSEFVVAPADLFQDDRKYTAFGVGTLGLLGRNSSDSFELECDSFSMIGTKAGRFGDNLNNPDGSGRQIVLTMDQNVFCKTTVTFTFERSGGGFTTSYDVSP